MKVILNKYIILAIVMIICSSNGLCQDRNVRINDAREFVINEIMRLQ